MNGITTLFFSINFLTSFLGGRFYSNFLGETMVSYKEYLGEEVLYLAQSDVAGKGNVYLETEKFSGVYEYCPIRTLFSKGHVYRLKKGLSQYQSVQLTDDGRVVKTCKLIRPEKQDFWPDELKGVEPHRINLVIVTR